MTKPILIVTAVLFAISGVALAGGGIWLASLGGSWFYIPLGLALIVSAVLIRNADARALWLHAATILVTLAWAIREVGFDWWQLAPRGDWIVILGLVLLLPFVFRPLEHWGTSPDRRVAWAALAGSIALSIVVAVVAFLAPASTEIAGTFADQPMAQGAALLDPGVPDGDWHEYGRTSYGQRFSPLAQLTPDTVGKLQEAWTFHTGDIRKDTDPVETTYEVTPLKIGNTVYLCTPHDLVFALDAETGKQLWRFDPSLKQPAREQTQHLTCRGLSYDPGTSAIGAASNTDAATAADCRARLFLPTADGRLIALSPVTGQICPGFGGPSGTVNLWANMPNVNPGSYYSTSPPVVTGKVIVVGGAVNDNVSTHETSGVVRAFDLATGALVWNFDSLNPDATTPLTEGQTYSHNGPNSWSIASYDPKLDLVFLPMGNQTPDQFGADRQANAEKFSAGTVALHADTGKVAWVFQGTHHDLWDMDVPAQPSLIDLKINGQMVPALVQATKQGEIFVLNRATGEPILPVTEEPAPKGGVAEDRHAPTQPHSALSFNPPKLTEHDMWGVTPFDELVCRIAFRSLDYDGRNTPPSVRGAIVYPGNFGAFNWGGVAVDPERQVVFGMPVALAYTSQLIPRQNDTERLVTKPGQPGFNENFGAPYASKMATFLSPLGLPCQAPPWGFIAGADLTTGKTVYKHINGTVRDLSPLPLPLKLGVPGIGGPIVTRGGLAFLSGTLDYYVRAYDVMTGKQLWESRLPAGGQATPMTYWSDASKRQFLLVVAGGHGSTGTKAGDSIIAYALPK